MKKAKEQKSEVNLVNVIKVEDYNLLEDDCFGHLYDITDKVCSLCADKELCMILYQDRLKKKKKILDSNNDYFDLTKFNNMTKEVWLKIKEKVSVFNNEGNPLKYDELVEIIKKRCNIQNDDIVKYYIQMHLPIYNLYLKDNDVLPLFE